MSHRQADEVIVNLRIDELLDIPALQSLLDSLYNSSKIPSAIIDAEPSPIGKSVRYHENPPAQMVVRREAGQSGSIKLSRLVITIVIAVLICVFSVVPSQAVDPQNKGQAAARRSLKTIIVDNYQPYTFMNEKGSPDGFSVEIIKAVAKVMDLDLEIRAGTWEHATKELEHGRIDLLPMMAYSVERDKTFDFSVPHTIAYDAIFHRSGDKSLGSFKDLSGKTVIVMNKDATHDYLLLSGLSKTMHLQLVDSLPEALRQLSSGKGDAAIMPKLVGIITLKKLNLSNIDPSPPVIDRYTRPFSFAVKEGDQALLERLNQGLGIIKTTGQYDAIYKKWFGALEAPRIPWKSVLQLVSLAGIILIAFAAWNVSLKHQVKSRTKDLEAEVAERKLKEEALRESEERFRDLVENSQDLICTHDLEGRILSANPWAATFLGYAPEELLRMNFRDLLVPEVRHEFGRYLDEIRTHGVARGLLWVQTRNGERRLWEYKNTLRTEGVAEPIVRGMAQDITERKQAEETIRQSERKLSLHLQQTMFAVIEWDAEFRVREWNPAATAIFGYSREEAMGRHAAELIISRNISEDIGKVFSHLLAQSGGTYNTNENVTKDGRVIVCEWFNTPLINERGTATGAISFALDITERRRAEEELRRSEDRFATVFRASPISTSLTRLSDGTFLDINDAFLRLFGYDREQVIGRNPLMLNMWVNLDDRARMVETLRERGRVDGFETTFRRKSGEIRNVIVISEVVDVVGEQYILGLTLDITNHKNAEAEKEKLQAQLLQAMKMEAVGRLAGGVAHDFNNLLTVITGYSELLLQKIGKESPMHGEVEEIKRAGERAALLTQQLLAFSRKQIIEPKVLHLDSLVAEMHKMLTRLIGEDIALQATTGKSPGSVKVDPGQFQQILMNLVVNARDAMPDGGKIMIETANVDLDEGYCALHPYVNPGRFVMLSVSDTGAGMSEEVKKHIFEPFFTTKEVGSGTGLGLATAYGAVKQVGGSIEVYSEVGIGTTFKIYLPRVEEEATKPVNDDRPTDLPGGTETVLIVEDEGILRNLCVQTLEPLGYRVLQARNGTEAIAKAQAYGDRIDLLLTDVVMPGMNGSELATQLVLPYPEMKVLFTSGYTEEVISHHGVLAEGVSFIGKPYTPSALARKVRRVLDDA